MVFMKTDTGSPPSPLRILTTPPRPGAGPDPAQPTPYTLVLYSNYPARLWLQYTRVYGGPTQSSFGCALQAPTKVGFHVFSRNSGRSRSSPASQLASLEAGESERQ